jgi:hypothetical protein
MSLLPPGVSSVQTRLELPGRYRAGYIDAEVPPDQGVPLHVDAAVYQVVAQTSYLYLMTTHSNDAVHGDRSAEWDHTAPQGLCTALALMHVLTWAIQRQVQREHVDVGLAEDAQEAP